MSKILHLHHEIEYPEAAQTEIRRWKGIANRYMDELWDERRAKWSLARCAFLSGVLVGGLMVWVWG